MDSKKPEKDKSQSRPSAEDRVDALIAGKKDDPKPEPGQAAQRLQEKKAQTSGKPVLTEKQRIEARRKRQSKRRRPTVTGNALSRGVRATGFEAKRTFVFLGRSVLAGIDALKPVGGAAVSGLKKVLTWIGAALLALSGFVTALLAAIGRLLLALDGVVTARRAFTVVALVAAGLLVASQFMDFRAIEIGQPGYVQVQDVTMAPRTDVKTPIDTHSFILLIAGVMAFAAAALTAFSRRRLLAGTLVFAGGLTLAVALAIDMPVGLDADNAELSYAGVKAILLSGFWLELAAGAVLLISGIALALQPEEKRSAARRPSPARPTVAGSRA